MEPGGIDPGGMDVGGIDPVRGGKEPGGIDLGGMDPGGIDGAEAGGSGGIDAGGGIRGEPGGIDLGVGRGTESGAAGAAGTGIERGVIGPREIGRGTDGADAGTGCGGLEGGSSRAIVASEGYGLQGTTQTFPQANQASFEKSPIRSMHRAPYDRSSSRRGVRASFGSLTSVRVKMSSRRAAKPSA